MITINLVFATPVGDVLTTCTNAFKNIFPPFPAIFSVTIPIDFFASPAIRWYEP